MKDEEADGERALPRGARHPADYVIAIDIGVANKVNTKCLNIE